MPWMVVEDDVEEGEVLAVVVVVRVGRSCLVNMMVVSFTSYSSSMPCYPCWWLSPCLPIPKCHRSNTRCAVYSWHPCSW